MYASFSQIGLCNPRPMRLDQQCSNLNTVERKDALNLPWRVHGWPPACKVRVRCLVSCVVVKLRNMCSVPSLLPFFLPVWTMLIFLPVWTMLIFLPVWTMPISLPVWTMLISLPVWTMPIFLPVWTMPIFLTVWTMPVFLTVWTMLIFLPVWTMLFSSSLNDAHFLPVWTMPTIWRCSVSKQRQNRNLSNPRPCIYYPLEILRAIIAYLTHWSMHVIKVGAASMSHTIKPGLHLRMWIQKRDLFYLFVRCFVICLRVGSYAGPLLNVWLSGLWKFSVRLTISRYGTVVQIYSRVRGYG